MTGSAREIFLVHLGQSAFELAENLLEAAQRDALGTLIPGCARMVSHHFPGTSFPPRLQAVSSARNLLVAVD